MRFIRNIFILVFLGLLALPVLQMRFVFAEEEKLNGVVMDAMIPSFSMAAVLDGKWQQGFTKWFEEKFGFRGHLVKTDNQMNFSLFKEISANTNAPIVLGKEDWLYEKGYIDNLNGRDYRTNEELEAEAVRLKELQQKLRARGVPFLLVLAPSKATVYPEYIPDAFFSSYKKDERTNRERLLPYLNTHGVQYFDAHNFLEQQRYAVPAPLFAKGGTHWNYYAVCLYARDMIARLEQLSGKDYVNIGCDPATVDERPYGSDEDIAKLINIWDEDAVKGPTLHPTFSNDYNGSQHKPDVLFIGDSFSWQLLYVLDHEKWYTTRDFYYYFSKNSRYPEATFDAIDHRSLDWEQVFSQDGIIIEASETAVGQIGFGFVEAALNALDEAN